MQIYSINMHNYKSLYRCAFFVGFCRLFCVCFVALSLCGLSLCRFVCLRFVFVGVRSLVMVFVVVYICNDMQRTAHNDKTHRNRAKIASNVFRCVNIPTPSPYSTMKGFGYLSSNFFSKIFYFFIFFHLLIFVITYF